MISCFQIARVIANFYHYRPKMPDRGTFYWQLPAEARSAHRRGPNGL